MVKAILTAGSVPFFVALTLMQPKVSLGAEVLSQATPAQTSTSEAPEAPETVEVVAADFAYPVYFA